MIQGLQRYRKFLITALLSVVLSLYFQSSFSQGLLIQKTGPTNGNPGDVVTYTINYVNKTGNTITNVVIKDTLPTQFTYTGQSSIPAITFSGITGGILTWNIPSLVKNASGTITVTGRFGLLGSIGYPSYDPAGYYVANGCTANPYNLVNNASMSALGQTSVYASLTSNINQCCGSSLSPPTQNGSVKKNTGQIITYTYTLTNTGNIHDKYYLTYSYTGDLMGTAFLDMGNNVITSTPWLIPGSTFQFQLQLTVGSGPPDVTNVTTIIANSVVCGTSSSANAITFEYNGNSPPPPNTNDLIISKFSIPFNNVVEPNFIFYTISVFNNVTSGNKPANNVFITDELPPSTTYIPGSAIPAATVVGNTVTWNAGTIASNGIYLCTVSVTTSCNSVPSVLNKAYVTSTPVDADTSNNHVSVTTTVIDNTPPVARCKNATLTLDATGNATLQPSLVDNGSTDDCGTITLSVSPNTFNCSKLGNNNVTLTVTDRSGNFSTCTAVVNVISDSPVIAGQPSNVTVCAGSNASFNVVATGTALTYQWQVNPGTGFVNVVNGAPYGGATTATLNITGATTGMNGYTYRCVLNSTCPAGANVTSNAATLTVNALPVPTLTGPASVCINSTGNVYTTQVGMTNYVWTVSAGGTITAGGTATSSTVSVTWNTLGAQTVRVNYTNANGCSAAAAVVYNVTVNALPVPTLAGPTPVCTNIPGNVYTTQAGMTNYIWTISAGGTITAGGNATSNTVTVTWTTAGAQTVRVNYTNANGCAAAAPVVFNVTVNAGPSPTLAGPASICVNTTGNVYTTQAGMTNYVWAVSAGGTITAGGTAASSSVTVTWNTAGAQTVSVNYRNAVGCSAASPTVFNVTVNPTNTIILSSEDETDAQTVCINTAIINIKYTTTGATGATITGLPAGVNGNWVANVVTISGTPTASGVFTYTITLTGGCGVVTKTGTITVKANNTISLSSAIGTDAQTVCINTAITHITYTTSGATGATVTGLPAGVNGNWVANVVTISGTPTASGVFTYTITLTGGCGVVTKTGTITVRANNTIALSSAVGTDAQTVCINTAITNITYITTGATGATVTGLPAGVNGNWAANVVTISGTPTASGVFTYTISLTGGCGVVTKTGTITVNPLPVPTIAGPTPVCVNAPGNVYSTQAGMTNYIWAVSAGGNITAGGGVANNTVTVTWTTAGAKTVSVNYTNSNGCRAAGPVVFAVNVNPLPITSPIYHN